MNTASNSIFFEQLGYTNRLFSITDRIFDPLTPIIEKIATAIFSALAICIGIFFTLMADGICHLFPKLSFSFLYSSSQQDCDGFFNKREAQRLCESLNKSTKKVKFYAQNLSDVVMGGVCTALSFDFTKKYFEKRKIYPVETALLQLAPIYKQASEQFRTMQAAFNTIRKRAEQTEDFQREKIEAMLSSQKLKVIQATDLCNLDQTEPGWKLLFTKNKIERMLQQCENGVFVIRALCPMDNEKEESHGHTTILIRENNARYHYDPNFGVEKINPSYEAIRLKTILGRNHRQFKTPLVRMYKVAPA